MSELFVRISNGSYRNMPVNGTFKVLERHKTLGGGDRVINVLGAVPGWEHHKCRVKINHATVEYVDGEGNTIEAVQEGTAEVPSVIHAFPKEQQVPAGVPTRGTTYQGSAEAIPYEKIYMDAESEDEAMERIKRTFELVNELTEAAATSEIRSLIISGPPGIGKSYGVEETLRKCDMLNKISGHDAMFEIVKGAASPIGVYQKLYEFRDSGRVLVFDDCDRVLFEEDSLNLLKAALDTTRERWIYWLSESKVLKENDVPPKFKFDGSVVFLTNINFESNSSRISNHLGAILSRCHYLDMEIGTVRDRILRIKQIVRDGMLDEYNFDEDQVEGILSFIIDNKDDLRELSLRMVIKIADLVKFKHERWEEYAEATCLHRNAKFRRLYEAKSKQN